MQFFLASLFHAWEHAASSAEHNVGVEILPDVEVALHNGLIDQFVEGRHFESKFGRIEHNLWGPEALVSESDGLSVRESVSAIIFISLFIVCI